MSRPTLESGASGGRERAAMIGRTYTLRGEPVVVLARWFQPRPFRGPKAVPLVFAPKERPTPRNVRIRHADGTLTIRPFRGLRKASPGEAPGPLDNTAEG